MSYTSLLKNILSYIYNPEIDVAETIEKFFHPDYEQRINGASMNRAEYIQHVWAQRKSMTIETIDYKQLLEKENEIFAIYYPRGLNKKNLPIEAEVIAYFRFQDSQLFRIHGQVRLMKGDLADVDMKNA
jgi:hypothetical protein